ncbi:MAG: hypothetical protein AAFX99_22430 [Myxococcota bacterium]
MIPHLDLRSNAVVLFAFAAFFWGCTDNSTTGSSASNGTTSNGSATSNTTSDTNDTGMAQSDGSDTVAPQDTEAPEDTEAPPEDTVPDRADVLPDTRTDEDTAEPPDTAEDEPDTAPVEMLEVSISSPAPGAVFEVGAPITMTATIENSPAPTDTLSVAWRSSEDGLFATGRANAEGVVTTTTDRLSQGNHTITLRVTGPNGLEAETSVSISICNWTQPETFDGSMLGPGWEAFGSADIDPEGRGWLEMTGLEMGQKGAIFNTANIVDQGNIGISFRIMTGGGTGADGFAMSVIQAESPQELRTIVNAAGSGGALGYGYGGDWGTYDDVPGFHIELDTWHNRFNGGNEFHTDPTEENHIGVMLDGDPGNHYLWAELPNIEDQQWHDVEITITGGNVLVTLDGDTVIDGFIEQLDFKGGYIGFSGTTGFFTNYHRFDDLQIRQECLVE